MVINSWKNTQLSLPEGRFIPLYCPHQMRATDRFFVEWNNSMNFAVFFKFYVGFLFEHLVCLNTEFHCHCHLYRNAALLWFSWTPTNTFSLTGSTPVCYNTKALFHLLWKLCWGMSVENVSTSRAYGSLLPQSGFERQLLKPEQEFHTALSETA